MTTVNESGGNITELVRNLESQLEMHTVLLEALEAENNLPASCTIEQLKEIHISRDFAAKRIFELEKQRLNLMKSYQEKLGAKADISFKDVIAKCKEEEKEKLINLRQDLLDVIEEIKPVGKSNAETAMARISCFNEIQGALDKSLNRLSTYSNKGAISKQGGSPFLKRSI